MNCSECQEILSRFIDGELDEKRSASVSDHLAVCAECTVLCDDLAEILLECREPDAAGATPPNPAALWRRINNLIESELPAEIPIEEKPKGWFARGWNLTFSQAGIAMLSIALISSLLTVVGIRNYYEPPGSDLPARGTDPPSTLQRVLSKVGLVETPQQARERRI